MVSLVLIDAFQMASLRGRRDSTVAIRDSHKTENLCQGRLPRMGKEIANWETVFISDVYQNVLARNLQKLVKKTAQ